jgi:hypothetical protein
VKVCTQSASVHHSQGQFSLSNLRRKSGVETLAIGFPGEGSKATTYEHLKFFPSSREQRSSGGGATKTVRSIVGRDMDRQIRVQYEGGMHEEKYRSHPSNLGVKDQQALDPGKVHGP